MSSEFGGGEFNAFEFNALPTEVTEPPSTGGRDLPTDVEDLITIGSAAPGFSLLAPLYLIKWQLASGTEYFSSGEEITYDGNVYEANRVKEVSGLTAQFIDRKSKEFGKASITFDNYPNGNSTTLPFQALDAAGNLEDRKITVYLYFRDAEDAVLFWWGYSGAPKFSDELQDMTCTISATFLWDSDNVVVPSRTLPEAGFSTLESNRNSEDASEEFIIPLAYGVDNFQIRPTIYATRAEQGYLHANFIVSGTAEDYPFDANDVPAADMRIFGNTAAEVVEFYTGDFSQTAPADLSRFPDGEAHEGIAYGYAAFPINDENKDRVDDLEPDEIKMVLVNGRPLIDTGLPSENPVLILRDILRDPNFGLGLDLADFDATAIISAASFAGSLYQSRLELHERISVGDLVQRLCTEFGGYVTFNNGKIQIGVKNPEETVAAQFSTINSGYTFRKIHDDQVNYWQESADETVNELLVSYRKKNRHKRKIQAYDPTAQTRPGANIKKVVSEDLELISLFDEEQVSIAAATYLREEQSANLFIEFKTPILEGLSVVPGQIIEVRSASIINNSVNYLFRIIAQTPEIDDEALMSFICRVYKPVVYDYNTDGIGVDIIRGSTDTSSQGRPPNVTPVSLAVLDTTSTNDTEGKLATIRAIWTYPTVDLTTEQTANNIIREYPIGSVQLWWKYDNESIHEARLGKEIRYPVAQGDFQIDYYKNRSIDVYFVALGHNRSRLPLGYIPDVTKTTSLTANLTSTAATASVATAAAFAVNDYAFIEREIAKVASKTSNTITFLTSAGNRAPQFSTTAIAHPSGTEIAVAKQTYPSLNLALTAPRFTYPTVTGVVARLRETEVRLKWADVDSTNLEDYYIAYSTDGDAGSNVAKLGSATPAWYLSNPLAPPFGINLILTKSIHKSILYEDIGGANSTVFARVFARNGKHNYSTQLSSLVSNFASGGAVVPTDPPSTPHAGLIIKNEPNFETSQSDAIVIFRVYADVTQTKTFTQTGALQIIIGLLADGQTKPEHLPYTIDDLSATFVDIPLILTLGKLYSWKFNIAANGAGNNKSTVATISFYAGGFTNDASLITSFSITSITTQDSRTSRINYQYTQPSTPVLLGNAKALKKLPAEVSFFKAGKEQLLDEETLFTSGVKADYIEVKTPKATNIDWRIRLTSVDGTQIETATFNATTVNEDTAVPSGLSTPVAKYQQGDLAIKNISASTNINTIIAYDVVIEGRDAGGSFLGYLETTNFTFTASEATAKTDIQLAGKQVFIVKVSQLVTAFGATGQIRAYFYARNAVGTSSASTASNSLLISSLVDPMLQDTAVPTLASPSAPQVTERFGELTVSCPTPTANINTMDEIIVVLSTSSSAPASTPPSVGSSGVVKIHRGQTVNFKAKQGDSSTLYAYYVVHNGVGYSAWSSGGTLGVPSRPADDVIGTGVPTQRKRLERSATSQSGHGSSSFILDASASAVDDFYNLMALYVPSLAAGDAVQTITDYVASTKTVTVSPGFGSTPVGALAFEIYAGLELAKKSGTGHSTTTFVLDASASAVDDFYNGMWLYIPSRAATERLRQITDYVGSTKTCTVGVAFSGTPSNSIGYMINDGCFGYVHPNNIPGDTGNLVPTPFRIWKDTNTNEMVVENQLPSGENAYSLTHGHLQIVRQNASASLKVEDKVNLSETTVYRTPLQSGYSPAVRGRFQNKYRESGSDGNSAYSYYAPGIQSTDSPPVTYDPGAFTPPSNDIYADGNLPTSRYPTY